MFDQPTITTERLPENVVIPADYYDEAYYNGLPKANWDLPYTWENMNLTFAAWAAFILSAFPEARSFLDVGCGKGFLERAIIQTVELNKKSTVELHGFDVSAFAIAHAEEKAKPHLVRAGVDDFAFAREYEVMICLDLFEHLTEEQAERFLRRSRRHVGDCCFFMIATDNKINRLEPSHITLRDRAWWHRMFLRAGWVFSDEMREFLAIMNKNKFIANSSSEAFLYSSGKSKWHTISRIFRALRGWMIWLRRGFSTLRSKP